MFEECKVKSMNSADREASSSERNVCGSGLLVLLAVESAGVNLVTETVVCR